MEETTRRTAINLMQALEAHAATSETITVAILAVFTPDAVKEIAANLTQQADELKGISETRWTWVIDILDRHGCNIDTQTIPNLTSREARARAREEATKQSAPRFTLHPIY